ncbi:MAG TPA: ammonium transporter [Candidatus Brocadiia bacterium]|nr:ammonium transporter [Candidatus Brocadiia bacterium]
MTPTRPRLATARRFIPALILALLCLSGLAFAADTPSETAASVKTSLQNALNIVWVAVAAFLVFFMQAGFAMVETGFTRAKNACNIMMKNLMDFAAGTVVWFAVGFGLMFSAGNGFVGFTSGFFGSGADAVNPQLGWTYWIFQCVFAGTAATIVSGAMAERTRFTSYLLASAAICALIYPISGHWFWSESGWLAKMGYIDFAGSTVVHSCGGWIALAGAIALGPRLGKYGPDGRSKAIPGHNIPLAALGVFILWFGWFGFNPGSTLSADASIGYIALTTNLAAAAGALAAMFASWIRSRKPDVSMTLNGVLAGLVAVTAGCKDVTPLGALVIGGVAGVLVVASVEFVDKVLCVDDPVGAVSVHGVCGAWGSLALVFFLKPGSAAALGVQLLGVACMFAWAFGAGSVMFFILKRLVGLRVPRDEELRGLDIPEHGNEAYPGFQVFTTV